MCMRLWTLRIGKQAVSVRVCEDQKARKQLKQRCMTRRCLAAGIVTVRMDPGPYRNCIFEVLDLADWRKRRSHLPSKCASQAMRWPS
jgi:hypothetical protein